MVFFVDPTTAQFHLVTHLNVGNEDFCTTVTPCGEDEGDCDSYDECQDGLACGSNNCPASLGFDSEVDCCHPFSDCTGK